jgi:hypothetical protein
MDVILYPGQTPSTNIQLGTPAGGITAAQTLPILVEGQLSGMMVGTVMR